ncbi:MAG: hypothetical protein K2N91_03830, partial [Muribaculaceae bacterium]|nr:hypothetical protein [Muribaculaceae bacterium]
MADDPAGNEELANESDGNNDDQSAEGGGNSDGQLGEGYGNNEGQLGEGDENNGGQSDKGEGDSSDGTDTGDGAGGEEENGADTENGGNDGEGTDTGEDGAGDDIEAGEDEPVLPTQSVEVEIPVQWECEEDYENTELTEYTFRPTWDSNAWFYEEGADADSVPTITVSYTGQIITEEVSTEEELAAAFAAGLKKITLKADIALTETLWLPATADIELDGQGYSLLRGKSENELFIGTMISMDGEEYTEETYGTLTLKDITVDGRTPTDRAGAPVILDCGSLILEKDAVVRNNYNYGTYPSDEEDAETILDYGGGIQVYGKLSVTEESQITGNFADEFGGGVYLADGATLYLYADVIRENSVSEDAGYGADLYAARGSTIYYDSSIDMERDGFYLCEGVILICMQGKKASRTAEIDRHDDNVEIFISAAEGSGYDDKYLDALTKKLESEPYNYSVIPKMAQVDTSDLRDWYVYDHYDTASQCWGSESETDAYGKTVPKLWQSTYGDNPKRKYYPCTEKWYNDHSGAAVYTIADWLNKEEYKNTYDGYNLAQFKEHIYSRGTDMTFAGYGNPAYVDFMFYDPQSNGEKVVDFDIDSSQVIPHALSGMGFLVNAGVDNGLLYGYLVYYHYNGTSYAPGGNPTNLYICKLNGVNVEKFHGGTWDLKTIFRNLDESTLSEAGIQIEKSESIPSDWGSQMSIRIKVSPTKIDIWQQTKGATADIGETESVSLGVEDSGYSGFGPLVAYTSYNHNCEVASCFTYSNIHMYYTNSMEGSQNGLQPLEYADYTQEGTQKYFVNLFGKNFGLGYNNIDVESYLYQAFLKLMQVEGIALITDRETPFAEYLGESGESGSNLCEMDGNFQDDVDALAAKIAEYIGKQTTTYIQHKLPTEEQGEDGELINATPMHAVGNIWLESATEGGQIRGALQGNTFTGDGYKIQIRDDIAYYNEGRDKYTVRCDVIKPNGSVHSVDSSSDIPSFVVGTDPSQWPAGRYTVRQTIMGSYGESAVHGYAYFDLERPNHTHDWSESIEKEPSCTTTGRKTRSCSICGKTETVVIPANGHRPKDEWNTSETEHWHECIVCKEKFDIADHQFDKWSTNETGHWRECEICKEKFDIGDHQSEEWSKDENGHWHECVVCKEKYDTAEHQSEEWSKDENGHWHECVVCKEKYDTA